jgi:hypothetical protein
MPVLKVWSGSAWVDASGSADWHTVGPTAPSAPPVGALWLDTVSAPTDMLTQAEFDAVITKPGSPAGASFNAPNSYGLLTGKQNAMVGANVYWDGVNWQRYDTAQPYTLLTVERLLGALRLYSGAAGANPIGFGVGQKLSLEPIGRLQYILGTDNYNNTTVAGGSWIACHTPQNFTIGAATSWLHIEIRFGILLHAAAVTQTAARLVINSTTVNFSSGVATPNFGNLGPGLTMQVPPATFPVGTNTIGVQTFGNTAYTAYFRCASVPNTEWLVIIVREIPTP